MNLKTALEYQAKGLINIRTSPDGKYAIACYSRDCFYAGDGWDDVTRNCRGTIFNCETGEQINHPYPKIFNVDEVPETADALVQARIASGEPYLIMDKVDGHLFIVSRFLEDGEMKTLITTKGAFPYQANDSFMLLDKDIEEFRPYLEKIEEMTSDHEATFLFEAMVAHDNEHPMWAKDAEAYGIEASDFILHGAFYKFSGCWKDASYQELEYLAGQIDCPVIKMYQGMGYNQARMKEAKGVEGFVIKFLGDGFRVKVKTTEYWHYRAMREFGAKSILPGWAKKGTQYLHDALPEEIAVQVDKYLLNEINNAYCEIAKSIPVSAPGIFTPFGTALSAQERKELFTNPAYSDPQRQLILGHCKGLQPGENQSLRSLVAERVMTLNEDPIQRIAAAA